MRVDIVKKPLEEIKIPKRECLAKLTACYNRLNILDWEVQHGKLKWCQLRRKEKPIWAEIRYYKFHLTKD